MSFKQAQSSRLILGSYPLSGHLRQIESGRSVSTGDMTVLADTARKSIPGLRAGTLGLAGPLDNDGSATGSLKTMNALIQAAAGTATTYGPHGTAIGSVCQSMVLQADSLATGSKFDAIVDFKFDLHADGALDTGIFLADLAAITSDTNGTGQDNSAGTTNGGAAFLHVTAFSGFSGVVFKVQHSTDNSNWNDLATFTTVAAITSERVEVAAATTVNRYLRSFADVTGSGSVTFAMTFCRR